MMPHAAPVHRLPPEVALQILTNCSDFSSLYGLAQCSPFWSVFRAYAAEVVESVMDREVPVEVKVLMRGVLGLQTTLSMVHTLEEAQAYPHFPPYSAADSSDSDSSDSDSSAGDQIEDEEDEDDDSSSSSDSYRSPISYFRTPVIPSRQPVHTVKESNSTANLRARAVRMWPPLPQAFPADEASSATVLMRFLSLAHKIHCLAHACLELCLDRLRQRQSLAGPRLQSNDALGPPSWLEEQRVLDGLWRIQFFYELQNSRQDNRLLWSCDDLAELEGQTLAQFYIGGFVCDLVIAVLACLEDMVPAGIAAAHHLPSLSDSVPFDRRCEPNPFPHNFLLGSYKQEEFRTKGRNHMGGHDFRTARKPFGTRRPHSYDPLRRQQEYCHIDLPSSGWKICSVQIMDDETASCEDVSFAPFAKLGFAFWEDKRTVALGLWSEEGRVHLKQYHDQCLRFLTPEEVKMYTRHHHYN